MNENTVNNTPQNNNQGTVWRFNPQDFQQRFRLQGNMSAQHFRTLFPRGITPAMAASVQQHQHHVRMPTSQPAVPAPSQTVEESDTSNSAPSFVLDMGSAFDTANGGGISFPGLQFNSEHFQLLSPNHDENQNTGPQEDGALHSHAEGLQRPTNVDWSLLLMNSLPFIIILLVRLVSDHILGLLVFLGLVGTFFYANMFFKKLVHESSLRDALLHKILLSYFWIMMFLTVNIGCVYYSFKEEELWKVLTFQWPAKLEANVWVFFWIVTVNDFILKYTTIIIKALLSMAPIKSKHRGKYYMFTEHIMQLYRMLITVIPWYHFLSDGFSWMFAATLLCVYFLCKGYQIIFKVLDVKNAFLKLLREKTYGIKPSHADLKTRGENCPICQEDYKDPVMLNCKHIFCEDCVSVWFDREKTCPMCRAQIHTDNSMWKDGSTSVHIQWY